MKFVYGSRILGYSPMHSELLLEFSSGWSCDNAMTAMAIRAGEPIDPVELIELASGAKTVFSLATLACRGMDRVSDCHRVWTETLEIFRQAQDAWSGVREAHIEADIEAQVEAQSDPQGDPQSDPQNGAQNGADGQDPLLRVYWLQSRRLRELAAARVELYTISQADRLSYVRQYKSDLDEDIPLELHGEPPAILTAQSCTIPKRSPRAELPI